MGFETLHKQELEIEKLSIAALNVLVYIIPEKFSAQETCNLFITLT